MSCEIVHVHLGVTSLNCSHQRDSDAGADIAHEIEQACGIAHSFHRNRIVRNRGERNEDASHSDALPNERPKEIPVAHIQV